MSCRQTNRRTIVEVVCLTVCMCQIDSSCLHCCTCPNGAPSLQSFLSPSPPSPSLPRALPSPPARTPPSVPTETNLYSNSDRAAPIKTLENPGSLGDASLSPGLVVGGWPWRTVVTAAAETQQPGPPANGGSDELARPLAFYFPRLLRWMPDTNAR
jgi:hypothetical protein